MDTNQQNKQDNYQINTFAGGMNTDTSYDMVLSNLYLFGLNIRITNNTLLKKEYDSNSTENIITPVANGEPISFTGDPLQGSLILATASIENTGAIITSDGKNTLWRVYKADLNGDSIKLTKLFTSTEKTVKDRFSVVINKELEDHTKLYIADGVHQLMHIDLDDVSYYKGKTFTEDDLISNHTYPVEQVKIVKKISGLLKTQQVQYTYRFYKKYGINSKLAPITNKIQVIDSNRHKETGNAYNTVTSVGFQLLIDYTDKIDLLFDHILIFRISYIKEHQNAEVNLICDNKLAEGSTSFVINDTGIQSLAEYSMDEFAALSGTVIKPQTIEQNQGYMFAANVKDESIIRIDESVYDARAFLFDAAGKAKLFNSNKTDSVYTSDISSIPTDYYINEYVDINNGDKTQNPCRYCQDGKTLGGDGQNVSWKFITTDIPLDTNDTTKTNLTIFVDHKTVNDNPDMYHIQYSTLQTQCSKTSSGYNIGDYLKFKNVECEYKLEYDDMFVSSLFRSLGRDEVYRYGIVFYDKFGTRTDTLWIADIRTPNTSEFDITDRISLNLYARPIGIEFKIKKPVIEGHDIVGYQIVRCEKSNTYTKNLMLCALSRPLRQGKYESDDQYKPNTPLDTYRTPYYPNMFLTTLFFYIVYGFYPIDMYIGDGDAQSKNLWTNYYDKNGTNVENKTLYQLFAPSILYKREDELSKLSHSDIKLTPLYYSNIDIWDYELSEALKGNHDKVINYHNVIIQYSGETSITENGNTYNFEWETPYLETKTNTVCSDVHKVRDCVYLLTKYMLSFSKSDKVSQNIVLKSYSKLLKCYTRNGWLNFNSVDVKHIADVKNPTWEQGFTEIQLNGSDIISGIKQYKAFQTAVGSENYVNWVCNGMYDMPLTLTEAKSRPGTKDWPLRRVFIDTNDGTDEKNGKRNRLAYGWVGPGPICFLAEIEKSSDPLNILNNHIMVDVGEHANMGTVIANIQHTAVQFAGITKEEKQYDLYYGFGNFGKFEENESSIMIFDGDKYITPCEFVNMFKTYNFNDIESTIPSGLVVYYIPLESDVNTYFDYGMNFRNTSSANLQLEPGTITGVSSLERPLHQYNAIYSDNNTSNDVFSPQTIESLPETFLQRVCYSLFKLNGESIDSWHVFKPADFIDTDTRYGQVNHLLTVNDTLYYWQNSAFGKFSVNERSLITDNNSNTIQLGQGGVLQRTDYLSTKYGMRDLDHAAISAEDGVFWIDMNNKALVACSLTQVLNYGEVLNVQNLVNRDIDESIRPTIHYDLLNQELLSKMFKDKQLVSSLKVKAATAVYTREYKDVIVYNNTLYGLNSNGATRFNYIKNDNGYLKPTILLFVINSSASQTKVFDNLKVVTLKRDYNPLFVNNFMKNRKFEYDTDMYNRAIGNLDDELITDREGNICYTIPRWSLDGGYGQRMRGKWMKETITDYDPKYDFSISHIITKFRQSYS